MPLDRLNIVLAGAPIPLLRDSRRRDTLLWSPSRKGGGRGEKKLRGDHTGKREDICVDVEDATCVFSK